jgi:hypothetical protein
LVRYGSLAGCATPSTLGKNPRYCSLPSPCPSEDMTPRPPILRIGSVLTHAIKQTQYSLDLELPINNLVLRARNQNLTVLARVLQPPDNRSRVRIPSIALNLLANRSFRNPVSSSSCRFALHNTKRTNDREIGWRTSKARVGPVALHRRGGRYGVLYDLQCGELD